MINLENFKNINDQIIDSFCVQLRLNIKEV